MATHSGKVNKMDVKRGPALLFMQILSHLRFFVCIGFFPPTSSMPGTCGKPCFAVCLHYSGQLGLYPRPQPTMSRRCAVRWLCGQQCKMRRSMSALTTNWQKEWVRDTRNTIRNELGLQKISARTSFSCLKLGIIF